MIATEDMPAYCLHVVYSHATGSPRPLPYQGPLASTPYWRAKAQRQYVMRFGVWLFSTFSAHFRDNLILVRKGKNSLFCFVLLEE